MRTLQAWNCVPRGMHMLTEKLAMCLTLGVWVIPLASINVKLGALCSFCVCFVLSS